MKLKVEKTIEIQWKTKVCSMQRSMKMINLQPDLPSKTKPKKMEDTNDQYQNEN